ncbi:hypothetical protein BMS3Bbin04_00026 [bacterium BMS3Bbin04]|nr:hypothetical protein BMS3Bbin04_00026 [bacterium BMS3Bbin04]
MAELIAYADEGLGITRINGSGDEEKCLKLDESSIIMLLLNNLAPSLSDKDANDAAIKASDSSVVSDLITLAEASAFWILSNCCTASCLPDR